MGGFVLRVKFKTGQKIVDGLTPEDNVLQLKRRLSEVTGVSIKELYVLTGFPPKALDLSEDDASLQERNITSGETLIVEEKKDLEIPESKHINQVRPHISDNSEMNDSPGILMKMVVPADNSCLFTSVGFVLSGKNLL